jgi:hypothetical protein
VIPSLGHVLKHASDVYLHERILAWIKAYELRIAVVKIVEKCSPIFHLMTCFCTCCGGIFVLLPKAVLLVFSCSSLFSFSVKLEELVTND